MTAAKLKEDFPQLDILTDDELESAIAKGGMLSALIRAGVKRLETPRKVGRPRKQLKGRKAIPRRGRKSDEQFSPNSSNIRLAELALTYAECLKCSHVEAAKATLLAVGSKADSRRIRKLAKLIADATYKRRQAEGELRRQTNAATPTSDVSSFSGMLLYTASLSK